MSKPQMCTSLSWGGHWTHTYLQMDTGHIATYPSLGGQWTRGHVPISGWTVDTRQVPTSGWTHVPNSGWTVDTWTRTYLWVDSGHMDSSYTYLSLGGQSTVDTYLSLRGQWTTRSYLCVDSGYMNSHSRTYLWVEGERVAVETGLDGPRPLRHVPTFGWKASGLRSRQDLMARERSDTYLSLDGRRAGCGRGRTWWPVSAQTRTYLWVEGERVAVETGLDGPWALRHVPIFGWKASGLRSRQDLMARDRSSSCSRLFAQFAQLQLLQNSPFAKQSQYLQRAAVAETVQPTVDVRRLRVIYLDHFGRIMPTETIHWL